MGKEYLEKAIAVDPNFALAYAGLAECSDIMTSAGRLSPLEGWSKVKEEASKALAIDESLSEPHVLLADFRFLVGCDFKGAEDEFLRAIELNPGNATARQYYAIFLSAMGRQQDAITQVRTALELDPLSLSINQSVGAILRLARQYDLSIGQLEATVSLDRGFAWTYWSMGEAYTFKAQYEKALEAFEKALSLAGEDMALIQADTACAYALWGKAEEARRILSELLSLSKKRYVSPFSLASIYAALEEKDEAFSWHEKAYEERANNFVFLKVDPRLDGLRSDARFESLLDRVGLSD
jgi:tetratricopeptide (TPR) repeat protein